jgi:uncharacterized membrane protein
MTELNPPSQKGKSRLAIGIFAILLVGGLIGTYFSLTVPYFGKLFVPGDVVYIPGGSVYEVIYVLLTMASGVLYLVGGVVMSFGAFLVAYQFIESKLRYPFKPSGVTKFLSGYLTLSLELFIGAEIIRTVVVRTTAEFTLLILVIVSRGLFSLILYLERRWRGTSETE